MLVARHAALSELKLNSPNVEEGILLSRLVAYCSKLVRYSSRLVDSWTRDHNRTAATSYYFPFIAVLLSLYDQ